MPCSLLPHKVQYLENDFACILWSLLEKAIQLCDERARGDSAAFLCEVRTTQIFVNHH